MSMETLQKDFKEILATVNKLPAGPNVTADDLVKHLKTQLYPLLESVIEEMVEMDTCIDELADIADGSDDVLCEDSAKLFGAIIAGGAAFAAELEKLAPGDAQAATAIAEYRALCERGTALLEEIVIPDTDDDDDDDKEDE